MQAAKEKPKKTILLVDNDKVYLSLTQEFLTTAGYEVITANNPIEANHLLTSQIIDLALLDVRLVNDDDAKDRVGLNLARDVALHIPKIIVTRNDTAEMARAALRPSWNGPAPAIDFLVKTEGLEALLTAVRAALLKAPSNIPIRLRLIRLFFEFADFRVKASGTDNVLIAKNTRSRWWERNKSILIFFVEDKYISPEVFKQMQMIISRSDFSREIAFLIHESYLESKATLETWLLKQKGLTILPIHLDTIKDAVESGKAACQIQFEEAWEWSHIDDPYESMNSLTDPQ